MGQNSKNRKGKNRTLKTCGVRCDWWIELARPVENIRWEGGRDHAELLVSPEKQTEEKSVFVKEGSLNAAQRFKRTKKTKQEDCRRLNKPS